MSATAVEKGGADAPAAEQADPLSGAPFADMTVVVQAGGESRRMGRSKALVEFLGEPLVARCARRLAPVAGELVVTTNDPERVGSVLVAAGLGGVRLERDQCERRGALRGLLTALTASRTPLVAVVAVDMVLCDPRLVAAEREALAGTDAALAIPHVSAGFEPFHATYRARPCLSALKEALAKGAEQASTWFVDRLPYVALDEKRVRDAVRGADCFANVNTPAELRALERRACAQQSRCTLPEALR